MNCDDGEQANARDPNANSMQAFVQHFRVIVKGFRTCKDQHVSCEVTKKKNDEGEAGNGDEPFFSN